MDMNNEARPALEEMEERLHRWMEATRDPFEYGKRGPRGFLDLGKSLPTRINTLAGALRDLSCEEQLRLSSFLRFFAKNHLKAQGYGLQDLVMLVAHEPFLTK